MWSEDRTVNADSLGIVSVILGSQTEIALPMEDSVYLEVVVDGEVLSPRREVVSVPFALHAAISDRLGGFDPVSYTVSDSLSLTGTLKASTPVENGESPSTAICLHYGGYFKAAGVFGRGVYGEKPRPDAFAAVFLCHHQPGNGSVRLSVPKKSL